jgi:tetratricopeptide (TPR) repeat protein
MSKLKSVGPAQLVWHSGLILMVAAGSLLPVDGQTRSKNRRSDPQPSLAVADLYYRNNDISDKAAAQYRRVRDQFPNSKEAARAQYFLGSYYHRKFYIQKDKKLKEELGLLIEAQGQYEDYVNRYAWKTNSPDWLADAYFNLALVFLQRGENKKAEEFLGKMYGAAPYDRTTHVYQVIWSPNTRDIIDSSFDSRQLSEYANSLIYSHAYQQKVTTGPTFDTIVDRIKLWCKGRKSLK